MPFVMNSSTPEGLLVYIQSIFVDIVPLNMIYIEYKHNYGAINIDDPK